LILCSCCVIRESELEEAIRSLREQNPNAQITPNRIYREIGRKPECAECTPLLLRRINLLATSIMVNEEVLKGQDFPRRLK